MTVGQRFLLTLAIALAILLALAAYGYFTGGWEDDDNNAHVYGLASAQSVDYERQFIDKPLSKYERQLIDLDRAAISEAYKDQIHHLFLTWAKDERDQPKRAVTGARQARSMYERSMSAIDERERRLQESGGK